MIYEDSVILTFDLIPPSHNQIYKTFKLNGVIRKGASKELKQWQASMNQYQYTCAKELKAISKMKGKRLAIITEFYFEPKRIFCQSKEKFGEIKKLDVSNYIKALHDWIAEKTGVDDKHFFTVLIKKLEATHKEKVTVTILGEANT